MAHKKEGWKEGLYGDEVREKILEFAEEGWESIPEDEREMWFSRFKFWGVFHQRTGQESYFMMRLTNANGRLQPGQLRAIGEVARDYATGPVENPEFGDSWIDFTTRQSVQLHWILEDVPEIWEKLEAVGVTTRSSGGDTMRNISGSPVAGKDKHEVIDTLPLLDRFQEEIRGDDALCNMPRKFNISISGTPEGGAQDSLNDIGLEVARKEIDGEEVLGFNVRVGGGLGGREPRVARPSTSSSPPTRRSRSSAASSSSTTSTATGRFARRTARASSSTNTAPTGSESSSTRSTSTSTSGPPARTSARGTRTTRVAPPKTGKSISPASTSRKTADDTSD